MSGNSLSPWRMMSWMVLSFAFAMIQDTHAGEPVIMEGAEPFPGSVTDREARELALLKAVGLDTGDVEVLAHAVKMYSTAFPPSHVQEVVFLLNGSELILVSGGGRRWAPADVVVVPWRVQLEETTKEEVERAVSAMNFGPNDFYPGIRVVSLIYYSKTYDRTVFENAYRRVGDDEKSKRMGDYVRAVGSPPPVD